MQPVLALELSTDGILLHELSYDGVWRRISAASLNDPFLPKKMVAMKHAARASQGRFFKNQVWLPPEQIKGLEVKLTSKDPVERQAEAEAFVRADPKFSDGEYIVQFGEEDVNGYVKIAAINRAILQEANRFVSGYGFGTQGFTSRDRIDGFYKQPYFSISAPPKYSVNFAKIGFFAGIAIALAAIAAAGYWAYNNIEFAPDPSVSIQTTEERILEIDEDPRAPIRPTDITANAEHQIPTTMSESQDFGPQPEHDITVNTFEALIKQAPLSSSLEIAQVPQTTTSLNPVNARKSTPMVFASSDADNLPAPETAGFPVVASKSIAFVDSSGPSVFAGGAHMQNYNSVSPDTAYVSLPRLTDVLPRDDSTVAMAAQLRKYNDSMGLTLVRESNAALLQIARTVELQLIPAIVIYGKPSIVPTLRSGEDVSVVFAAPVVPEISTLTIAELQALPAVVNEGFPRITPLLRDGRDVSELPPDPEHVEINEPATNETVVQFTTIVSGLTTVQLQLIPPRIFEGRPAIIPQLRSGSKIDVVADVVEETETLDPQTESVETEIEPATELSDAARLRPIVRPDSVEIIALVASLSKSVVPTALAPLPRPNGFTDRVQAMADAIAEQARVTPTFNDAPREVDVPTSANVARTATIENGINLNAMSLIGVFGTAGNYRALLRQRGGKYKMLEVGDKIDGWAIVAISESEVRIKKGSKTQILKLPAEG